jgi:hypothetical protein
MTQLLRRKATILPDPAAMQRKSNSFRALAKTATKQTPGALGPAAPPKPPALALVA